MSAMLVLVLRILLAICLYAFLLWAFLAIWRDLHQQGLQISGRRIPTIHLNIQTENSAALRRAFQTAEVNIGRDPGCDICIDDGGVSARHARLIFHHAQWWLEDLGSTNGTRLNQSALELPAVLTSGDEIAFGRTTLLVDIPAQTDSSPTLRASSIS